MAKMKIYEIARSMQEKLPDIKSKDLVKFLQENGFEAKSAQSTIEDSAIAFLLKNFSKLATKQESRPAKADQPVKTDKQSGSKKGRQTKNSGDRNVKPVKTQEVSKEETVKLEPEMEKPVMESPAKPQPKEETLKKEEDKKEAQAETVNSNKDVKKDKETFSPGNSIKNETSKKEAGGKEISNKGTKENSEETKQETANGKRDNMNQNGQNNKSSNNSILGTKIDLIKIPEWANIQEETAIQYVEKPLFSYYKPPTANNIDPESPIGVSVYTRAINLIKEADRQWGRIVWEYEASEKAVYVDDLATKPSQSKKKSFSINKLKERLYKTINTGKESSDFFKDYSPEIRDEALWRGLNKTLQRIEFNVGLAYGTLSEPNTIDKTATEIKASKQRSYATVSKMQENLQKALENLIYAMDVLTTLYNLAPQGNYEVSFNWDDSLVVDTEREQTLQMQEVTAGLRSKIKYIMFRYGLTEEQAQQELNLINKEKQSNTEMFGFTPKEE